MILINNSALLRLLAFGLFYLIRDIIFGCPYGTTLKEWRYCHSLSNQITESVIGASGVLIWFDSSCVIVLVLDRVAKLHPPVVSGIQLA